ncbi:MAG: hypothetical protein IJJ20_09165, partial [Thermoguttaceae bacterium]|nr:hypothetical protein [Thermoguttaceae bacterium]
MSIFSFFRKAQKGLGKTSKKGLEYRRFKLEGLEERTLLTAAPWSTGDDPSVTTMIVVTDAVPVVTEVDDPSVDVGAGVNVLTEAQPEDTVYVSVYVKSTDPQYGVSGGYCTLYFDNTGFTATDPLNGGYTVSPIMNTLTMLDASRIACSTDEYISGFGGMPTDIQAAYGYTQWALAGTQQFTVSADADGDYVFSNGMMRNSKGVEKESNNFIREDSVSPTYVMDVEFASTTLTVNSQPQPSDAPVVTAIAVSYDIPTATEIDEVTSLTEVKPGETVYVSVYVKSTDPLYGVSGGYCTLYFDNTGFVPTDPLNGGYTVSPIMETMTMIDTANCACSTDEYIS